MKVFYILLIAFFITNSIFAQDTKIRFFANPGFELQHRIDSNYVSPYFRGGPLVLFATSQISDRFSAAAELNAHYMANTGAEVEIERIFLKYYYNDALSFRVGRMYTPIGYWNLNYNFGLILQPNISRPLSMNPTHDGGFNLTRDAGIQIESENLGKLGFNYKFLVSNGIGKNAGLLGADSILGTSLCYTGQLGIEPIDGLKLIASGQINPMVEGQQTQYGNFLSEKLTYTYGGFSLVYLNPEKKLEFIGEVSSSQHQYDTSGTYNIQNVIGYLGYKVTNKVIPYFFYEASFFPDTHPYFPTTNEYNGLPYQSIQEIDLGIRYKVNPNVVLKMETGYRAEDITGNSFIFKTQAAFGF
jgi:hypothetical protein